MKNNNRAHSIHPRETKCLARKKLNSISKVSIDFFWTHMNCVVDFVADGEGKSAHTTHICVGRRRISRLRIFIGHYSGCAWDGRSTATVITRNKRQFPFSECFSQISGRSKNLDISRAPLLFFFFFFSNRRRAKCWRFFAGFCLFFRGFCNNHPRIADVPRSICNATEHRLYGERCELPINASRNNKVT